MTPVDFPQSNKTLLPPEQKCSVDVINLPVWTDGEQCVSRWQMTWAERFSAFWYGKVWVATLSGSTQVRCKI
jgi:hypothetical protein